MEKSVRKLANFYFKSLVYHPTDFDVTPIDFELVAVGGNRWKKSLGIRLKGQLHRNDYEKIKLKTG